jgi:hypothetical protein
MYILLLYVRSQGMQVETLCIPKQNIYIVFPILRLVVMSYNVSDSEYITNILPRL